MKNKTANEYYKEKFGCKVYKLSVDAGFTCPNRDGTVGIGGCIFCSGDGSGEFAARGGDDIARLLEEAKVRVAKKIKDGKYIAYLQAFTNTYAPVDKLREIYSAAIAPDYIVGLAIGTRPDCLGEDVLDLLSEINGIKPVSVELGLQTSNDVTAEYINRGYKTQVYLDAVKTLRVRGIDVVTHIILGLPGETREDWQATARTASEAGTSGIKFHFLYVTRGTRLEKDYLEGKFSCLELEEYAEGLKSCLDLLPEDIIIHRITGDGAKKDLVAPLWSGDKKRVLNYLAKYLK
ncbi:MAG: TIGR01212 family radical SAM protein [Clostridia bacterium]|nr:TIGR01212 family radical SAM protein [Clostridia bacterium]